MRAHLIYTLLVAGLTLVPPSSGHGRMMKPPARNAMWRCGYPTKPNYDDNGLFCGGFAVQWQVNHGKCGLCGDAYNAVREHETGGSYANNITVNNYEPGSIVDISIEVTANHGGTFQFSMCWRETFSQKESESCFEPLKLADGSSEYPVSIQDASRMYSIQVKLPKGRECEKCILRWHWRAGNNWGQCEDGTSRVGCGPQETFRNCADVSVLSKHSARSSDHLTLQD